jgi:hypothetical protein
MGQMLKDFREKKQNIIRLVMGRNNKMATDRSLYIQHLQYRREVVITFQTKEIISAITNISCFLQSLFLTSNNDSFCNYHL